MKLSIVAGATSQTLNVFIQDSSSTVGAGLTGLVYNTTSLVAYYAFPKAASVSITLATLAAVTSAYSSGGFKEIDSANMPGWYRFDLPNAALAAASGRFVSVHLKGAANMAPLPIEIELTGWDNQDGVHAGLTALPNAAATSSGGLPTVGTGASQIDVNASGQVNLGKVLGTAVTAATAGILDVNTKNYNNQAAATDANNLPKVDVEDWKAGVVPAVNVTGVPKVDVIDWLGAAPVALVSGYVHALTTASRTGTAQAGAAGSITLDAGASATNGFYTDQMVTLLSSTGAGQCRLVSGYTGSTKVATVVPNWATNPDNTSVFAVTPETQADLGLWLGTAMNVLISGRVDANAQALGAGLLTVKKNTALANFEFVMFDSADHITPKTGLTVTAQVSIDGAAFATATNSVVELSNGVYKLNLAAADLNGTTIMLRFTATGADATLVLILTQA